MSDLHNNRTAVERAEQAVGRWQRWQMAELPLEPVSARTRAHSASQQKKERDAGASEHQVKAAREAGFEEGRQAGFDQGLKEGREAGHAEGYEAGLAEGRANAETELENRIREAIQPLHNLMQSLDEAQQQLDDEIANCIVELALSVGQQLARQTLDAKPEAVLDIVRELLHSEPALSGKPRLWLHPDDLALVETHLGPETEAAGWQLQPDDAMQRGGCRLISRSGEIDASWDERVASVCRQVRKPRRRQTGSTASGGSTRSRKTSANRTQSGPESA